MSNKQQKRITRRGVDPAPGIQGSESLEAGSLAAPGLAEEQRREKRGGSLAAVAAGTAEEIAEARAAGRELRRLFIYGQKNIIGARVAP